MLRQCGDRLLQSQRQVTGLSISQLLLDHLLVIVSDSSPLLVLHQRLLDQFVVLTCVLVALAVHFDQRIVDSLLLVIFR